MSRFSEKLAARWARGRFTCVGLDPRMEKIHRSVPGATTGLRLGNFAMSIVRATAEDALMFKPNAAFWLCYGEEGLLALKRVIQAIHADHPGIPVLLDHKLGDIGSTNEAYVRYVVNELAADGVTLNPYCGFKANEPFLDDGDRECVWICRTSNPGSDEFQNQDILLSSGQLDSMMGTPTWDLIQRPFSGASVLKLHQVVAHNIAHRWNVHDNCSLVTGATNPEDIAPVRRIVGDIPLLVPGIGKQGGSLERSVRNACGTRAWWFMINSSRGVIHASTGEDFEEAASAEVIRLNTAINTERELVLAEAA